MKKVVMKRVVMKRLFMSRMIIGAGIIIAMLVFFPCRANAGEIGELFLDELELGEVSKVAGQYLPEKMSFEALVNSLVYDGEGKSFYEILGQYVKDMLFYEFSNGRHLIIQVICFALLFSVCNRFIVISNNYVTDMSFLMIYAAMMTMLLQTFGMIGEAVVDGIGVMISFMSALIPAYSVSLVISGNASTATVFYTLTFGVIYIMEWALKLIILPGIDAYVLLEFLNHIYREERFSKLAALIYRGICYLLKASVTVIAGIGVVQSLITPAKDRISDSMILRTFTSIPGVGNIAGSTGEILLGCGMLIKNSIGMAALICLLFITAVPFVKVCAFDVIYHVLAAMLQPVADKRIVDGINGIASGGSLYLKLLTHSMLLFFILIALVSSTTSFIH